MSYYMLSAQCEMKKETLLVCNNCLMQASKQFTRKCLPTKLPPRAMGFHHTFTVTTRPDLSLAMQEFVTWVAFVT